MIENQTPYLAERTWVRDKEGVHHWIVVVKATYGIQKDGRLSLAQTQLPPLHEPTLARGTLHAGQGGRRLPACPARLPPASHCCSLHTEAGNLVTDRAGRVLVHANSENIHRESLAKPDE